MKQLKFAAKKQAIGTKKGGDGLRGNKVLLSGNRAARPVKAAALARDESDALAEIARAAARAASRAGPVKKPQKAEQKKKVKRPAAAPLPPAEPVRHVGPARAVHAKPPRSSAALRAVGRPPSVSSGGSDASSSSGASTFSGSSGASSFSSSSGASSGASSVASSAGLSTSSRSSYGSGSSGSFSGSSMSLSSMSTVSPVPRDKGFDVLRSGGAKGKPAPRVAPREDEQEDAEKIDILARFHALKQRGVKLSKNYTPRSSLGELRLEMGRIEHESSVQRSVQRLRRWLLAFVSGAQYASDSRFAPKLVHGKLNGFSDYVLASVEDYDPIFERISEEHGGAGGIGSTGNPMMDLAILLGTQLLMFVFMSSKPGVKPPSAEEIKRDHPDLVRQVAAELAAEMRNRERFEEKVAAAQHAATAPAPVAQAPRRMPAPSVGFAPREPHEMFAEPVATLESLHGSTVPQTPWVSIGEALLPGEPPLPPLPPMPIPDAMRASPPPREAPRGMDQIPILVADAPRAQPPQPETFPAAPQTTKKFVELNESAMATRRGRTPKAAPEPKPNLGEDQNPRVIEIK